VLNYITSLQRADFRYHEGGSLPFLSSSEEQWGRPQKISEGNTRLSLLGYTLLWGNLFGGMIWKKIFLLACFEYKLEFTGEQWEVTFSC
jgi:hypothetical protein